MRNAYVTEIIDPDKVREDARARATGVRGSESTHIHYHAYTVPCQDQKHEVIGVPDYGY